MHVGQATGVPFAKLSCRRMAMQVHGILQKVNMLKVKQGNVHAAAGTKRPRKAECVN